jgi:hypothetical protein
MGIRRSVAGLLGVMVASGVGAGVVAGPDRLSLARLPFYERYDGKAPVSGTLLVGLQLGTADLPFNPDRIGVMLPKEILGHNICVAIASEDGRYAARNLYIVPLKAGREALLETKPDNPVQLGKYRAGDMAIAARADDECSPAGVGPFVPAFAGAGSSPDNGVSLVAYVNEDPERIAVRLVKGQEAIAASNPCFTFRSHTRIAFTSRCEVLIAPSVPDGKYDIELTVRGIFKAQTESYPV